MHLLLLNINHLKHQTIIKTMQETSWILNTLCFRLKNRAMHSLFFKKGKNWLAENLFLTSYISIYTY